MIWLSWDRASGRCLSEIIAVKVFKHQLYERTPHLEHVPPVEAMIPLVITNSFKLQRTCKNITTAMVDWFFFIFYFSKKGLLLKKSTGVLLLSHCSPLLLISYAKGNLRFIFFPFYPHIQNFKLSSQCTPPPRKICSISNMTLITNWGSRILQTNTRILQQSIKTSIQYESLLNMFTCNAFFWIILSDW
jgi:hypothetical protein